MTASEGKPLFARKEPRWFTTKREGETLDVGSVVFRVIKASKGRVQLEAIVGAEIMKKRCQHGE